MELDPPVQAIVAGQSEERGYPVRPEEDLGILKFMRTLERNPGSVARKSHVAGRDRADQTGEEVDVDKPS